MVSIGSGEKTNETETRNDGKGSMAAIDLEATVRTDGGLVMSGQSGQTGKEAMTAGRTMTNGSLKKVAFLGLCFVVNCLTWVDNCPFLRFCSFLFTKL
jgi:hypothetical protein